MAQEYGHNEKASRAMHRADMALYKAWDAYYDADDWEQMKAVSAVQDKLNKLARTESKRLDADIQRHIGEIRATLESMIWN